MSGECGYSPRRSHHAWEWVLTPVVPCRGWVLTLWTYQPPPLDIKCQKFHICVIYENLGSVRQWRSLPNDNKANRFFHDISKIDLQGFQYCQLRFGRAIQNLKDYWSPTLKCNPFYQLTSNFTFTKILLFK